MRHKLLPGPATAGRQGLRRQPCADSAAVHYPGIRTPDQLASLAAAGLDSFTFSPAIARALFDEPLTVAAAAAFEDAAERGGAYAGAREP